MNNRVKLTKAQAELLRTQITEINALQQLLQTKVAENKRVADMLVTDAGADAEAYQDYKIERVQGEDYIVLTPKAGA